MVVWSPCFTKTTSFSPTYRDGCDIICRVGDLFPRVSEKPLHMNEDSESDGDETCVAMRVMQLVCALLLGFLFVGVFTHIKK